MQMDNSTGKTGEDYVAGALKKQGYMIKARNFKTRFGEIDIIAADRKYIVFVEVKTRKSGSLTNPLESVTLSKQRKVISAAEYYLMKNPESLQPRFDVAAVTTQNYKVVSLEYIKNAFGT
mgnify:CR=1 FL=1